MTNAQFLKLFGIKKGEANKVVAAATKSPTDALRKAFKIGYWKAAHIYMVLRGQGG